MGIVSTNMGLKVWDLNTDPYDHNQLASNWDKADQHDHRPGRGALISTAGIADGAITAAKLDDSVAGPGSITADQLAVADRLGLSGASTVRRGHVKIATQETRTATTFDWLPTPDRVSGLILPLGGLIFVGYRATWMDTTVNTGQAALFLTNTQVSVNDPYANAAAPSGDVATTEPVFGTNTGGIWRSLMTAPYGLASGYNNNRAYDGDVNVATDFQVLGNNGMTQSDFNTGHYGITQIFAAPGTYDVGVKYLATSGTVTVKDRELWVWTKGF